MYQKPRQVHKFKQDLQKRKETQGLSTQKVPMKAIAYAGTEPIRNNALKSASKKEPIASPKMVETTGFSQGRVSRTLERTVIPSKRSVSQISPGGQSHELEIPLRGKIVQSHTESLQLHHYCYLKKDTREDVIYSHRALTGSFNLGSFTGPAPSEPLDTNDRSNGRQSRAADRSGATRLRSASQGLRNLGNTCYMNSILQCLAKLPWFKEGSMRPSTLRDDLCNEFFILMKKMQENDSDTPLDPFQFRKQISALGFRFSSSEQNDAHEFLLCLLSRLSKSEQGPRDLVKEFLLGRQQNVIRFNGCKHVLNTDQPFFSVSLPINLKNGNSCHRYTTVDLLNCLEVYTQKEDVDGDALCMDCNLMQCCSIKTSFTHLPKFLIIHLKRYDFLRAEKLESEVSFPLKDLTIIQKDVDRYGKVTGHIDLCTDKAVIYDLIAVCNHYGSLRFGHYTADIKSPSNNWYNYSDSRVTQNRTITSYSSSLTSREASILFYERSD